MANQHKRPAFTKISEVIERGYARSSGKGSKIYRVELVTPEWVYLSYLGFWAWGRWEPARRSRCFVVRKRSYTWEWRGKTSTERWVQGYIPCQRTEFTPKEIP